MKRMILTMAKTMKKILIALAALFFLLIGMAAAM